MGLGLPVKRKGNIPQKNLGSGDMGRERKGKHQSPLHRVSLLIGQYSGVAKRSSASIYPAKSDDERPRIVGGE
jgi:hypothetical protein